MPVPRIVRWLAAAGVGLPLSMIDSPDGVARRLHELWRDKLTEAQRRYAESRNEDTRTEYLRVLKIFSDLVIRDKAPPSKD